MLSSLEPCGPDVREPANDPLRLVWNDLAPELSRLVGAMGIGAARVDDVLQEVYLAAWQKRPAEAGVEDLRRWLFRVTINRCNLEHRQRRSWRRALHNWVGYVGSATSQGTSHESPVEQAACRCEQHERVRHALGQLEPRQRAVLVLRYFADFDSREIGKILGMPDSTVRSHLRIGRQKLADALKEAGYGHDETQL